MRNLLILAAALLAGLIALSMNRPAEAPSAPAPAASTVQPVDQPAVPSPASPLPATSPTATPSSANDSEGSADLHEHELEEGVDVGGFDPNHPPAGAPDAASVAMALDQAVGYVRSINSYGYGDGALNDFITRSKHYMSPSFYQEWVDIAAMAEEAGTDGSVWDGYQTSKTRHEASTGTPSVTRWTATSLEVSVPYRTADVPAGGEVPLTSTERFARVKLVYDGSTWLVLTATPDF